MLQLAMFNFPKLYLEGETARHKSEVHPDFLAIVIAAT